MKKSKYTVIVSVIFRTLLVILFFVTALSFFSCAENTNSETDSVAINTINASNLSKSPLFSLPTINGDTVSMGDYLGKIVVIHIATTWCPYCNAEAPHLQKLSEQYKDKGVEVLLIDVKESKDLVQERLVDRFNLDFPVLLDKDGSVAASFAPNDILPELARDEIMLAANLVIDQKGYIQFMSLLDTKNFDSELIHVQKIINELL